MGDVNNTLLDNGIEDTSQVTGEEALDQLVGEGKKYGTHAELAKAMLHGQSHINTLEKENASMRDSSNKAKGVDDILEALKAQQGAGDNQAAADQQQQGPEPTNVEDLVAQAFDRRDTAAQNVQAEANRKVVIDSLAKAYGAQASKVYAEVGSSLNISLDDLSAKSPQAVLNLVAQARPAQAANNGLPPSTLQAEQRGATSSVLNHAEIQKMWKDGSIKTLAAKHKLEYQQATILGAKFYE